MYLSLASYCIKIGFTLIAQLLPQNCHLTLSGRHVPRIPKPIRVWALSICHELLFTGEIRLKLIQILWCMGQLRLKIHQLEFWYHYMFRRFLAILAQSRKTIPRSLVFQICSTEKVMSVQIRPSCKLMRK